MNIYKMVLLSFYLLLVVAPFTIPTKMGTTNSGSDNCKQQFCREEEEQWQ